MSISLHKTEPNSKKNKLFQQSFLKTPLFFKKLNNPMPFFLSQNKTPLSLSTQNSLLFTNYLKKKKNRIIVPRKRACLSLQGFSSKNEQNVISEFSYFQQISQKIIEKKQKEFENPNSELPDYYLPTLQAFTRSKNDKKPLVFLQSLKKICPFFNLDPLIVTRILLACDINPNNRFSPVSWTSFERVSRVLIHKNANFDENCEFLIGFFVGKSNFNENEEVPALEIIALVGKLTNCMVNREKPEELYEKPSLKEVLVRDLETSGAFSRKFGLSIRKFREALKRKTIDFQQYLKLILLVK